MLWPVRSGVVHAVPTTRADCDVSSGSPSPGGSALGALLGPPPAVRSWLANLSIDESGRPCSVVSANLPWRIRGGIDRAGDDISLLIVIGRLLSVLVL